MKLLRAHHERGEISLIAVGLILAAVAAATAVTVVVVKQNQGSNPGGFSLSVLESSATRDTSDLPVIAIRYQVDFQNDAAPQALQSLLSVHCTIKQTQLTRNRVFTGQGDVLASERLSKGDVVIKPGEDDKAIHGAFKVSCELFRDKDSLASAKGDDVNVPAPSGNQLVDITDLQGTYRVSFARVSGDATNCTVDGTRSVVATAVTGTTIKIELEKLAVYEGPLPESLEFKGNASINPGFTDYYGAFEAHFDRAAAPTRLSGQIITTDPSCTLSFGASREDS
jgi:hypothetical protein